jgi:hypothetical protein
MQSWVRGRQSFGVQGAHFPDLFRNMPMAIDPAVIGERDPKHGENIKQLALFGGDGILACGSAGGCSRLKFEREVAHFRVLAMFPLALSQNPHISSRGNTARGLGGTDLASKRLSATASRRVVMLDKTEHFRKMADECVARAKEAITNKLRVQHYADAERYWKLARVSSQVSRDQPRRPS